MAKELIHRLYLKVSCDFIKIDPVVNGLIHHKVKSHLRICDHPIVTFGIRVFHLGFSNTYHVDSLDRFRKAVVLSSN